MYNQRRYVYIDNKPTEITIRNYTLDDIPQLIELQAACFPPPFPSELWWNEQQLTNHVTLFPEGAITIEINGHIAASMTGLLIHTDATTPHLSWADATDNGYIRNHDSNGNTLYIVDISVHPNYRKVGLGKLMMESMYHVVIHKDIERLLGGGRIPHYHRYSHELSVHDYVEKVIQGVLFDPVLSFLLRCGRTPVELVEHYLEDEESHHYGMLMEWRNPFIKKES